MVIFIYFCIFLAIGAIGFLFTSLNILTIKKNTADRCFVKKTLQESENSEESRNFVSVLIPARNEEKTIKACLDSLLQQSFTHYEILIYDDASTDGTWNIISSYADTHPNISAIQGTSLPQGWNGKHYALHCLAKKAQGDVYLFTDADTEHGRDSIAAGLANLKFNQTDMISGYPEQRLPNRLTQIIVSLMHFNISFILPLWRQHRSGNSLFGLAIGQYICMKSSVYWDIGGYEAVKHTITDDIHIARLLISRGYTQSFIKLTGIVSCRMYSNSREAYAGISRNIMDFFDNALYLPVLLAPLFFLFILFPPFIFLYQLFFHGTCSVLLLSGTLLLYFSWLRVLIFFSYPKLLSLYFLMTLSLPVIMIGTSTYQIITRRGFQWKDRTVT